jgi:hypothetical protein
LFEHRLERAVAVASQQLATAAADCVGRTDRRTTASAARAAVTTAALVAAVAGRTRALTVAAIGSGRAAAERCTARTAGASRVRDSAGDRRSRRARASLSFALRR